MGVLRQEATPEEAGLDARALERLDRHFARQADEGKLPGFLVAVARGGRVAHLTAYGARDVAAGLPVESDTLWRIYSMTKPVTAVGALMLVEEGLLSLDDPVGRHLPAFAEPRVYESGSGDRVRTRPAAGPLLVRHLMTHTAGLTFAFYHAHPVDALYRAAGLESSVAPGKDLAGTTDVYASLPLQFEPGTQWNYSVAIERPGPDHRGRVRPSARRVPGRARLPSARHGGRRLPRHRRPGGAAGGVVRGGRRRRHRADPGLPLRGRPRFLSGSGGMVASAHDLHRFMEMLRRRGELDGTRLLAPATVDLMTPNHLPATPTCAPSAAPGTRGTRQRGRRLRPRRLRRGGPGAAPGPRRGLGRYGWSGVATTTFWVDPGRDLTVQFCTQVRPRCSHRSSRTSSGWCTRR